MERNNVAYIDGANLHKGIQELGWVLDYAALRIWLTEKYHVRQAYLFLGYLSWQSDLYDSLQSCGYSIVFKEITYGKHGIIKGNCDADIIVKAMQDMYEGSYNSAVLITADGDFASLVSAMVAKGQFGVLLSPKHPKKCSRLLKRTGAKIVYLNDKRKILEQRQNEKAPDADETA